MLVVLQFLFILNKDNKIIMKKFLILTAVFVATLSFYSCGNDDDTATQPPVNLVSKTDVIANYATIVLANYQEAYNDAVSLKAVLQTLATTPTQANHAAAKTAWLQSRESYGPSEAFRFAQGPIDDADGPEGLLNAWPMDESFVDYVEGADNSGIINDLTTYPTITKELLASLNELNGDDRSISIGYHAIEFLLWGQDLTNPANNQAGLRPFTDFVDGGTATNQDRRRTYLLACSDLLIDHLQLMLNEWTVGGPYRTTFLALEEDNALQNMFGSIAELSKSELAVERMAVALNNQDQEDEHSCFSDNTHRDIRLNYNGIINVYQGSYGAISGPSLSDLVTEADATLGARLSAAITTATAAVNNTGIPFDLAILGGPSSTEGAKVLTAVNALQDLGDQLVAGAGVLGITVNL